MTVTTSPTHPVVGDTVSIVVKRTVGGTSVTVTDPEIKLTITPEGSGLETGVMRELDGSPAQSFTPDVVGTYALQAVDFVERGAPMAFDGGPGVRKVVNAGQNFTVAVGLAMDLPIVVLGHGLTIRLKVHGGTISEATLVGSTTEKASAASQDATVTAKLAALVSVTAATVGPDIATVGTELATKYNAHRTQATVHSVNDTTNVYPQDRPYDQTNAIQQLNRLRATMIGHLTGASVAGARWHIEDDTKNVPVVGPASTPAEAVVLYADLRRSFVAHLGQVLAPEAHDNADITNTLSAVDKLTDLLIALLAFLSAAQPSTAPTVESGAVILQSRYGFKPTA
ncbi:MAG: hypothetical protein HOW73_47480 [Polyangiaceae bacterium]|nr:hypothetical protein [Polyangiaceae bacterium]